MFRLFLPWRKNIATHWYPQYLRLVIVVDRDKTAASVQWRDLLSLTKLPLAYLITAAEC